MKLPEADDGFEVVDDDPPPLPKKRPALEDSPPRKTAKRPPLDDGDDEDRPRRRRDDDNDDYEERPRKKKKKNKAAADNGMLIRNLIGGGVLLVVLAVGGVLLWNKFNNAESDEKPNKTKNASNGDGRVNGSSSDSDKADAVIRITNEMVQGVDQLMSLLDNMNDESSAQQATATITEMAGKMRENIAEVKRIGSISASQNDRIKAQMPNFSKMNPANLQNKVTAAVLRLANAKVPQPTIQALSTAMIDYGNSLKEFSVALSAIRSVR